MNTDRWKGTSSRSVTCRPATRRSAPSGTNAARSAGSMPVRDKRSRPGSGEVRNAGLEHRKVGQSAQGLSTSAAAGT
jgi:hypothetical protein